MIPKHRRQSPPETHVDIRNTHPTYFSSWRVWHCSRFDGSSSSPVSGNAQCEVVQQEFHPRAGGSSGCCPTGVPPACWRKCPGHFSEVHGGVALMSEHLVVRKREAFVGRSIGCPSTVVQKRDDVVVVGPKKG